MKVLSLSLTAIVLTFSSAVSASDFEEDKQYIACRKSASTDRQLIACQERLLERLNMSIAKALDRNMTLLTEGEKQKALRLARKTARELAEQKAKQNVRGEKAAIKKGIPRIMMGEKYSLLFAGGS